MSYHMPTTDGPPVKTLEGASWVEAHNYSTSLLWQLRPDGLWDLVSAEGWGTWVEHDPDAPYTPPFQEKGLEGAQKILGTTFRADLALQGAVLRAIRLARMDKPEISVITENMVEHPLEGWLHHGPAWMRIYSRDQWMTYGSVVMPDGRILGVCVGVPGGLREEAAKTGRLTEYMSAWMIDRSDWLDSPDSWGCEEAYEAISQLSPGDLWRPPVNRPLKG